MKSTEFFEVTESNNGQEGFVGISYNKWAALNIEVLALDEDGDWVEDEEGDSEDYLIGLGADEDIDAYLIENYCGKTVGIHHYRYLTGDYNEETEEFEFWEAGETRRFDYVVTPDGVEPLENI